MLRSGQFEPMPPYTLELHARVTSARVAVSAAGEAPADTVESASAAATSAAFLIAGAHSSSGALQDLGVEVPQLVGLEAQRDLADHHLVPLPARRCRRRRIGEDEDLPLLGDSQRGAGEPVA